MTLPVEVFLLNHLHANLVPKSGLLLEECLGKCDRRLAAEANSLRHFDWQLGSRIARPLDPLELGRVRDARQIFDSVFGDQDVM